MNYNWSPYAIGGATRPDSFSRMHPQMQEGLWGLLQAADQEIGGGLQVYSGYRSPELQAQLYQNALEKYGSEQAARKWVAPPGRSKHNSGEAADLKYNGVRIDKLPEGHPARAWLAENAGRFGLTQRMAWEPWQVELAGGEAPSTPPISPEQPAAEPAIYDFGITPPTTREQQIQGLASIAAGLSQTPAPVTLNRPQAQPLQFNRRDTTQPYMALFERMRNGYV